MIQESIKKLVQYGVNMGLTPECERIYTTNLLLECMQEDEYTNPDCDLTNIVLEDILRDLLDEAVKRGIIEDSVTYRDLFDTKLMNCLCPRPAQVIEKFNNILKYRESFLNYKLEYLKTGLNLDDVSDLSKYIKLVIKDLKQ